MVGEVPDVIFIVVRKKLLQQAREVLGEDVEGEEGVEMVEEGEKKDDEEEEENDEQMEDDLLERPKTQYKHSMKRHTDNKNTIYIKDVSSSDCRSHLC